MKNDTMITVIIVLICVLCAIALIGARKELRDLYPYEIKTHPNRLSIYR